MSTATFCFYFNGYTFVNIGLIPKNINLVELFILEELVSILPEQDYLYKTLIGGPYIFAALLRLFNFR